MIIIPTAYKLFRVKRNEKGKLFPLFVLADNETPIKKWIKAECGEKVENKVKSKLGLLAFRPAFHLSDIPLAVHIGIKGKSGKIEYMNPEHVWCEVFYKDDIDYQSLANEKGMINGKFVSRNAYLDYIPENGCYRYKTSPNQLGEWIMAGDIYINRILTDKEVREILIEKGYEPMPRYGGDIDLGEYGLLDFTTQQDKKYIAI